MKIENNNSPSITPLKTTVDKPAASPSQTVKPQVEKKLTRKSSQQRISKWFSQAGVRVNNIQAQALSIDEKVALKDSMLAQRKLKNLENILGRALDFCLDDGKEEDIDADWFFSFVNMAEQIFSPAMQELWGKIFAVETARPGSFSLKTLGILKQLTQKDAQIFRHAVNLTSRRKGESIPKLLIGYYQKSNVWSFFSSHKEHQLNLAEFALGYPDILSLMDLGLIHHSEIESGELPVDKAYEWRCAGHTLELTAKRPGTTLVYYKFTTTGAELCKLVTRQKQEVYVKSLTTTLGHAFNID